MRRLPARFLQRSSAPRVHAGRALTPLAAALGAWLAGVLVVPPGAAGADLPRVEIGGQYRILYNSSNFGFHQEGFGQDERNRSFWNQRFRTWLDVQADERTSAYLQLEVGHLQWGDGEFPKTYQSDRIGIETRRAFIVYQWNGARVEAGILGFSDGFGGILASADWDFSTGGVLASWTRPSVRLRGGFLKLQEDDPRRADDNIYVLDGVFDLGGNEMGVHVYLKDANVESEVRSFWAGAHVRRETVGIEFNGFGILNRNTLVSGDQVSTHGALKIEAASEIVAGIDLAIQVLVSTGDSDSTATGLRGFQTVAQSLGDGLGAQSYWSYVGLMSPRGSSDVNDLGISIQNRGAGLTAIQGRIELPVSSWFGIYGAAGFQRATDAPPPRGPVLGTELLAEGLFTLSQHLTLEVGASVGFLGDYYELPGRPEPDDLYEFFSRFQLEF
ncbi:MAG: hypothetical protein ACE5G2_02375 [Candidatus Krumholzibacteriia bacterium]